MCYQKSNIFHFAFQYYNENRDNSKLLKMHLLSHVIHTFHIYSEKLMNATTVNINIYRYKYHYSLFSEADDKCTKFYQTEDCGWLEVNIL